MRRTTVHDPSLAQRLLYGLWHCWGLTDIELLLLHKSQFPFYLWFFIVFLPLSGLRKLVQRACQHAKHLGAIDQMSNKGMW